MKWDEVVCACSMDCPDACSLLVTRDASGTVKLRGNPAHPITEGFTCAKINRHISRLSSPERILSPMVLSGNSWKDIGWDEALDLCARRIQAYRSEPSSILYFHGEGAKGALKQAGYLFFSLLGATRVRGSLCDSAGYGAYMRDFGSRHNNDPKDILNARGVANWGRDLTSSSVHMAHLVQRIRRKGAHVVSISPGGEGPAALSDSRVVIRPGTDRFLAAAIIRLLMERHAIREDVVLHSRGWKEFQALVMSHPLDTLLRSCGVSRHDAEMICELYAGVHPVATIVGTGLQRYSHGGENVRFINALAFLSGNIGCSGGGSYYHLSSVRNFNLEWSGLKRTSQGRFLRMPVIGHDIAEAQDPPIRMIWVEGANLVNQCPDSRTLARQFEKIEFKVVVDAFMTDTAQRADVILPARLMLEQEDIVGSCLHDYVHHSPAVLDAPGQAQSDFWILEHLGKKLEPGIILPDSEDCLRVSLNSPHLSISLEELREKRFVRADRSMVAYRNMQFDHDDGNFHLVLELHEEPDPDPAYPLRLLSLIRRQAIHSQMLTDEQEIPPVVWISSDSPSLKGIDPHREVFLVSPRARVRVRIEIMPGLYSGAVVYRRGDWMKLGGGVNQLVDARITDMGTGCAFYDQYVRLENAYGEEKNE